MAKIIDSKIPEGPIAEKWTNYKAHQRLVNPKNKLKLDIIVVGTLTKYGSLYEFNSRCWLYSVNGNTAIDEATIENEKAEKFFRNGVLYIRRNGVEYTVMGAKAE